MCAIEKLAMEDVATPLLSRNEGIMMALTHASYNHNESERFNDALKNLVDAL